MNRYTNPMMVHHDNNIEVPNIILEYNVQQLAYDIHPNDLYLR